MDILDEIKDNLESNKNLPKDIKIKMFELIVLFNSSFPNIRLDKLKERIKTVKIGRIGIFEKKGSFNYNVVKNEMLFSSKKLKDTGDANHMMMKGIIGMISSADDYYGFNKGNRLRALNAGFTEMMANFLVGNESTSELEEELIATNLICQIVGRDVLFDAYFNNDQDTVLKHMLDAEVN